MRGVMYVAYGEPAIKCLYASLKSLRARMGAIPVCAISDKTLFDVHSVVVPMKDKGGRSVKTQLHKFVPKGWDRVLYLDVDTVVLELLDRFFDPLELGWDMVMCKDEHAEEVADARLKLRGEFAYNREFFGTRSVAQFAGGLFSWVVNEQTTAFFKAWHGEWRRFKFRDQGALTRAISMTPLRIWPVEFSANAKHKQDAREVWHRHGQARQRGAQ